MHAEGAVTYQVSRDSTEGAHLNEWDAVMQCHKGAVILRHLLSNTRPPGTGHRPPGLLLPQRTCECTVRAGAASKVQIQIRVFPEAVLGPGNPGAQSVPLRPPANQRAPAPAANSL